ncbi:Zn-ribbon domain-containing OB-fold protein [Arthrobacter koreensis]|uniref:Zn-ribbon domain-containing OB-fold protein n=1 Tax=Arthrobacter koreensis TaxID=199136 RepID=UPI003AF3D604
MSAIPWQHGRRVPGVTAETWAYWESGADGELRIQYCGVCSVWQHPPGPVCRRCHGSVELAPRAVSGEGRIVSWTRNDQPWYPGQPVPFRVGYVELVEQPGLFIFAGLSGLDDAADPMYRRVRAGFQRQGAAWLPVFSACDERAAS